MYKMKKVFDCQDMPQETRVLFFEQEEAQNNCYITHEVMPPEWDAEGDDVMVPNEEYTVVDTWLLENGAFIGEYILIKHWW
jgi:hypothetical protein